ncbi:MAG: hypothetical protein ACKVOR_08850 [Flavobacteriales bacterium]
MYPTHSCQSIKDHHQSIKTLVTSIISLVTFLKEHGKSIKAVVTSIKALVTSITSLVTFLKEHGKSIKPPGKRNIRCSQLDNP